MTRCEIPTRLGFMTAIILLTLIGIPALRSVIEDYRAGKEAA